MKNSCKLKIYIFQVLSFSLLFLLPIYANAQKSDEQTAVASAEHFLQLIDSGKYQESWQQTAPIFMSQVSRKHWAEKLQGLRPPFGAAEKRTIKAAHHATSLPGAPEGEYVVFQFDTRFANKKGAIETVTMSHIGGEWLVAGYFIQ